MSLILSSDWMLSTPLRQILEEYPFLDALLFERGIEVDLSSGSSLKVCLGKSTQEGDEHEFARRLVDRVREVTSLLADPREIHEVTIEPGCDKTGAPESFAGLTLARGETLAIVGPTGSGKSRLLADIEWLAQGDTPTRRTVKVDGVLAPPELRFSPGSKLVTQLSQTMSFVIDLSVREFLIMHAECRVVPDASARVDEVIVAANELSGESFSPDVNVTALSGGQSRALMIADAAILGRSPIVLVDEIENAGIDRRRALDVLVASDRIVLLATHDPLLALLAPRRLVLQGGGIRSILDRSEAESRLLEELERRERWSSDIRRRLRAGERVA